MVEELGGKFLAATVSGNFREIGGGALKAATWLGRPGPPARWSRGVQALDWCVIGTLIARTSLHRALEEMLGSVCLHLARPIKGLTHDAEGHCSGRRRTSNMSQHYWRQYEWECDAYGEFGSPSFMLDKLAVMDMSWTPNPSARFTYGLVMPNSQVVPVFKKPTWLMQRTLAKQRVWARWDAEPGTIMRIEKFREWQGVQWWSADRFWVASQQSQLCPWPEDQLTWWEVMPGVLLEAAPVMEPDVLFRAQLD